MKDTNGMTAKSPEQLDRNELHLYGIEYAIEFWTVTGLIHMFSVTDGRYHALLFKFSGFARHVTTIGFGSIRHIEPDVYDNVCNETILQVLFENSNGTQNCLAIFLGINLLEWK